MYILHKNKNNSTNFFFIIILCLFSFFINYHYAKLGSFPIDTFLHYDSAHGILNGELPIRDYWVVSGLTVDFIQSLFFKIFGTNWFAYTLHSSLFNCLTTVLVYFFFLKLKINNLKAFLFSISFAILSYTISGTPFVDLHATFFLLITTLLIINNLSTKFFFLWVLIVFLIFLSFLSKQVPATYAIFAYSIILFYFFIKKKDFKKIIIIILSAISFLALLIILLKFNKIDLKMFYIQYLDFPRSIGSYRVNNFEFSINTFFNNYKFIIIPALLLAFIKIKKNLIISEEVIGFLIFLVFTIILIFHQLMTKNQIYIYFLIPILFGFLEREIDLSNYKLKKYFLIFLILVLAFITTKYHLRYNESRKFHDLTNLQLKTAVKANKIHSSLAGLYWKNPHYSGNALDEISILNRAQKKISSIKDEEIMLISHYNFLDSIISNNLNKPNKTFTIDGASYPGKNSKHYDHYKIFLINKIKKDKISKILFFKHEKISPKIITIYIKKKCYDSYEDEIFYIFKLRCFN